MIIPRLPAGVLLGGKYQLISEDKIVGGTEVVPNSLPFQISLQRRAVGGIYSQSCGGSIINENTILNAAHCVDGYNIVLSQIDRWKLLIKQFIYFIV